MDEKASLVDAELQQLVEFARNTDLQEIAIEKDGRSFQVRRSGVHPLQRSNVSAAPAPAAPAEAPHPPEGVYIRSSMVGTFFRADSPDRPPLVVEGTVVDSGQPVGSVEASTWSSAPRSADRSAPKRPSNSWIAAGAIFRPCSFA